MKMRFIVLFSICAAAVLAQTNVPIAGTAGETRITTPSMNVSEAELSASLQKTQTQLQQTLALLKAYNQKVTGAGVSSVATPPSEAVASAIQQTPPLLRTSGENLSANYGANYSVRSGQNLSANVSTPAAGVPPAAQPMTAYADKTISSATPPTSAGNETGVSGETQETLKSLALLQTELERALPLLAAANNPGRNLVASTTTNGISATGFPTPTGRTNARPAAPSAVRIIGQ